MGYKRQAKIYNLVFADPEMKGLEVSAKRTSMQNYTNIQKNLMQLQQHEEFVPEDFESLDELFGAFAKLIDSWNLEDDEDKPVPTTKEGLLSQDPDFVMSIIMAYLNVAGGSVDPELGKESTSGETFPEVDFPMELLSASPGN